jgi:hypothetical protein
MVSDTAITGGSISLRDRVFRPKIEVSQDGLSLAGSAGDEFHGHRLIKEAKNRQNCSESAADYRGQTPNSITSRQALWEVAERHADVWQDKVNRVRVPLRTPG